MTVKELLELAAKANGIKGAWSSGREGLRTLHSKSDDLVWNPLTDDGDALRLAVKLGLEIDPWLGRKITIVDHGDIDGAINENHDGDPYAATRRAIVRAAAEIGKTL